MHYGNIKFNDIANGPGVRISLFVSGCTNHCPGCFQPETWNPEYGDLYTKEVEDKILEELSKPWYQGITLLGGEPLEPYNQEGLLGLIKRVREEYPKKDIWMYTGNLYEDMLPGGKRHFQMTDEILHNIDVLVDGRFEEDKKDITLVFKGSSNQRIIDVKKTLEQGAVVLKELPKRGL